MRTLTRPTLTALFAPLFALAALAAATSLAEARHSCGSSTRTEGNCTITTTTLCDYRFVNGKRQEYIVGTQTSRSCTVPDKATQTRTPIGAATAGTIAPVKPVRTAPVLPQGPLVPLTIAPRGPAKMR